MKKPTANVCPGCSKHCPAGSVRCKYGHRYFEKLNASVSEKILSPKEKNPTKSRKWERNVLPGGLLWNLIFTVRSVKKSLRKGSITEAQILASLTEIDQASLAAILKKLSSVCTSV